MSNRERLNALAGETLKGEPETGGSVRGQNDRDIKRTTVRERGVFNGTNKKLSVVTKIPGYQLRWFNDAPGRIDTAVARSWWEFVTQDEIAQSDGNKVVGQNSDVGNKVRAIVGTTDMNEPLYAYLMKIKKEWFDEDQEDAAQKIRDSEKEMIKNGGMNTDRIGEKYLPDQRKSSLVIRQGEFTRNVN